MDLLRAAPPPDHGFLAVGHGIQLCLRPCGWLQLFLLAGVLTASCEAKVDRGVPGVGCGTVLLFMTGVTTETWDMKLWVFVVFGAMHTGAGLWSPAIRAGSCGADAQE